ncbi:MAG: hypothetical protein ABJH52_04335 [Henriciella sp.]
MADKLRTEKRDARLKSALRDNLKRRKAATRKPKPAEKPDSKDL